MPEGEARGSRRRNVGDRVELSRRFNGVESERIPGEPERRRACVTLAGAMEGDDMMAWTVLSAVPAAGGVCSAWACRCASREPLSESTPAWEVKSSFACYFVLDGAATMERR